MSARIRSSKTDLEELGEDYDDLADGFSKYAEEVKALTGFDIRIEGTTNQYKDLYDIMEGLSKVWGNLSDAAQARTAEILGGTRQLQVIASIISNWGDAAGAYETAMNSMGVATQANEIYMDTLEAKINQFKSTFQEFSYTVLNSDLLKFGVDAGTGLLNLLNNIIKSAGGLVPILTAIAGIAIVKNFGTVAQIAEAVGTKIVGLSGSLKLLDSSFFAAATGGELLTMGLGSLIAVIGLATAAYNVFEQAQRKALEQDVEEASQTLQELDNIAQLESKYKTAQTAYDDGKISKEAYAEATRELADALGVEKTSVEELNEALGQYKTQSAASIAEGLNAAEKLLMDDANVSFFERIFHPFKSGSLSSGKMMLNRILGFENIDFSSVDGILNTYDLITEKLADMEKNSDNLQDLVDDVDYQALKYFEGLLGDTVTQYRQLKDAADGASGAATAFRQAIQNVSASSGGTFQKVFDNLKTSLQNQKKAIIGEAHDLGVDLNKTLYGNIDTNNRQILEWTEENIQKYKDALHSWHENINDLRGSYSTVDGRSEDFDGLEIAFTPILQTDNGPEFLSKKTVEEYIWALIDQLKAEGGEWSTEDLLALDAEGIEIYGQQIKGLIADVGDTAIKTGEAMHFTGSTGALANIEKALQRLNVDSTIDGFQDLSETIDALNDIRMLPGMGGEDIDYINGLIFYCEQLQYDLAKSVHEATGEWGEYGEALLAATDAQTALDKQLESGDWNTGFENRIKAFEKFKELLENGMVGSKAFAAYKDYFGLAGMDSDAVGQWISSNEKYFQEGVDSVTAFFDTVASKSNELKDIATWDESTGVFWYDSTKLDEFADSMGWTKEQLVDMLGNVRMYFEDWETHSPAEAFQELFDAGMFTEFNGNLITSLEQLKQYTGEDEEAVRNLIDSINTLRNNQGEETIKLVDDGQIKITQQTIDNMLAAGQTATEVTNQIAELSRKSNVEIEPDVHIGQNKLKEEVDRINSEFNSSGNKVAVEVDLNINGEAVTAALDVSTAELEAFVGKDWETILSANNEDIEAKKEASEKLINGIEQDRPVLLKANGETAMWTVQSLKSEIASLPSNKTITLHVNTVRQTSGVQARAKGTKNAANGLSLLGDEYSPSGSPKPELVVSDGYAYLAGQHGPEVGYLRAGDVVYTASQTKKILGGMGLSGVIGAFSGGGKFTGGKAPTGYSSSTYNGSSSSSSSSSRNGNSSRNSSSSSSRSKSSSKSSKDEESEFERLYKGHQHLLAMDQEETEYYLNWLNKAYKEAYKKNEIELEDYWKYRINGTHA